MIAALKAIILFPVRIFRKMYDWTMHWAKTPQAPDALVGIAFMESSFFPIPPDVLLIAMVVSDKAKWFRNALICTAGSVTGALLGYWIGWEFYQTVGQWIVTTYHLEQHVQTVGRMYAQNAFGAIFTAAFTPIPYKVFTIAAGLFKISIPTLIGASIVGRAGRFFFVAGMLRIFGERISNCIEKYFDVLSIVFVAAIVLGYMAIKYLVH